MIDSTILHYRIIEKLGEGGMGVVYKAEDTKLKREVAIKFLPHHISANKEERKRFEIEAQAAASLNHPNITTIHSIEEANEKVFIVMEYIDGVELRDKIKTGPVPIDEAISIAVQIAEGLEAAHKKGIVHRDIKSQNIMITGDEKIKIMDFGLAKIKGGSQVTKIGTTLGTIAYMSPEQARGEEVDHRTDIWSFGVVLYEMVTGKLPFKGDYDQAVIYSILNEEPEFKNYSELNSLILKALAKNPEERYQTTNDLLMDLRLLSHEPYVKPKRNIIPLKAGIIIGVIAVLIIAVLLFKNSFSSIETDNISIAVLPFTDLSPTNDQAYLGDGLAEQLLNNLARIGNLKVTAKTSSFSLRDKNLTVQDIAEKLKVSKVLEGSVQRIDDKVRITATLIDASDGYQIWSETFNRSSNDIFLIQDEIGESVVKALKLKLLGLSSSPDKKNVNPQAYSYFLQGNYFHNLRGKENLQKSIFYYSEALKIDSTYAAAWDGLSTAYSSRSDFGYGSVEDDNKIALKYAKKAIELDSTLASAYSTIGWIKRIYYWDWTGADSVYQLALKIDPANSNIIGGLAALASTHGRFEEAIRLDQKVIEKDPLNLSAYLNLVLHAYNAGEFNLAISTAKKLIEINPKFPGLHMKLGQIYLLQSNIKMASQEFENESDELWQLYSKILLNYAERKNNEADRYLDQFIKDYEDIAAFQVAELYAYKGDMETAFIWLEISYELRDSGLTTIIGNPVFKNLENDPRYSNFLKKMNLPYRKKI
ncbi:MAG: hypothetical protein EHM47_10510 [Ignavibacteriales bacterium]|nr:MAG: hypothetical protein EHM47_10510 [Ignavibacteriales bacterium]